MGDADSSFPSGEEIYRVTEKGTVEKKNLRRGIEILVAKTCPYNPPPEGYKIPAMTVFPLWSNLYLSPLLDGSVTCSQNC